jgi:putative membrane protein
MGALLRTGPRPGRTGCALEPRSCIDLWTDDWLLPSCSGGCADPGRAVGACAVLALAVIFVSPLCALSSALFSARTVHHVLLVAAAAPLAAFALPRRPVRLLALAAAVHAAAFWLWHAPAAYNFALSDDAAYWLMQLSLLATAIWFWGAVRHASAPAAVAALLFAMIAMGCLARS